MSFEPFYTKKPKKNMIIMGEPVFEFGKYQNIDKTGNVLVGIDPGNCIIKQKVIEKIASKNKYFQFPRIRETDVSCHDPSRKSDIWLILKTEYQPEMKLIHSTLKESYFVMAQRMNAENKKLKTGDEKEIIEFFTFGWQENTINKQVFVVADKTILNKG